MRWFAAIAAVVERWPGALEAITAYRKREAWDRVHRPWLYWEPGDAMPWTQAQPQPRQGLRLVVNNETRS